jgi:hypothetical protein
MLPFAVAAASLHTLSINQSIALLNESGRITSDSQQTNVGVTLTVSAATF